ncbi:hypothetical protein ABZ297_08890 [Nonomuraea sp. NPDC005983]|uniref:hypothetical protein n=1 Tax=Nonomuraea sp. NPDC005983 TaxID=3155595 RepID=UPI00339FA3E5
MAMMLPAKLEEAFVLLGVPWPTENEDGLKEYAAACWRCAGELITDVVPALVGTVGSIGLDNAGDGVEALLAFLADYLDDETDLAHLPSLAIILSVLAASHSLAAVLVQALKILLVIVATYVAAALLWAAMAAVVTSGMAVVRARTFVIGLRLIAQRAVAVFRRELERFFGKSLVRGVQARLRRLFGARPPKNAERAGAKSGAGTSGKPTRDRLPAAPLERHMPLPRPEELRLERGADGLIVRVNGRSVHDFVGDLTRSRGLEYRTRRQEQTDLAFSDQKAGPVLSVLMDRRTGKLYEGVNDMIAVPDDLHPLLRERFDGLTNWSREVGPFDHGPDYPPGAFPHFSEPGTHAEVTAVNKALFDRTARGETVTPATLQEFYFDNRWIRVVDDLERAPCCANCTHFLYDVPNPVEYYSRYPHDGVTVPNFTPPYI